MEVRITEIRFWNGPEEKLLKLSYKKIKFIGKLFEYFLKRVSSETLKESYSAELTAEIFKPANRRLIWLLASKNKFSSLVVL